MKKKLTQHASNYLQNVAALDYLTSCIIILHAMPDVNTGW